MSSINFDNVYLLLIAIPLVVLFTVPFCIAVRKDNRNGHNITSQILHVLMALIIAFAAAGTSITTVLTETDIYIVADVSYSANKNLDLVDQYIKDLKLPPNSKVGLICFGKDYKLVSELGRQKNLSSVKNSGVNDSETNIAEVLNYAGTLFESDVIKRVVLITDGRQTDQVDTYAVKRAVDTLETLDVKVDAIYLDDNIDENTHEVQISGADYTRSAFIRHDEKVNVSVQSTYETTAIMTLSRKTEKEDGKTEYVRVRQESTAFSPGRNVVSFDLDTSEGGTFEYRVEVQAEGDKSPHNNTYDFTQTVSSNVKMLIFTGNWESMTKLVERYNGIASIDVYENCETADSIKNGFKKKYDDTDSDRKDINPDINIFLRSEGRTKIPNTVTELCKYDEIIIDGADLSAETNDGRERWVGSTEFLESLDLTVKAGKSLVTIGDINIQAATRTEQIDGTSVSNLQTLDDMLPVKFGKDDQLPKLYTIILDVSTSLLESMRFERAKEVAIQFLNQLSEDDEFCIETFNGLTSIVQTPIAVRAGRDRAVKTLEKLEMGTGTVIGRGIEQAYEFADTQKAYSGKQFLLITDGEGDMSVNRPGYDGDDGLYNFVRDMYNDGIVTSVVNMGPYRNSSGDGPDPNGPNVDLERLCNAGQGKYTDMSNVPAGSGVPDNLFTEMKDELLQYIIEGDNRVEIVNSTDAVLNSIDKTAIPAISGFVVGYAKPSAVTVLNVEYKRTGVSGTKKSPLYAYWRYGNGTVASFTSNADGEWIKNWYAPSVTVRDTFFDNLFDAVIPEEKTDYPYSIDIRQEESSTSIQVALADRPLDASAVSMKIRIASPDGEVEEQNFSDIGGYYYNYEFLTTEVGRYDITITYAYGKISYQSNFNLNVSYSSEYNEFASFEASSLFKALNGRGEVYTESFEVLNDPNEVGVYKLDFTIPLLIICVALYVVDIVIRKLKWEDVVSFFGGFNKSKKENKSGGTKK